MWLFSIQSWVGSVYKDAAANAARNKANAGGSAELSGGKAV